MLSDSPFTQLKEAFVGAVVGFMVPTIASYAIPSVYVSWKETPKRENENPLSIETAAWIGFGAGAITGFVASGFLRERYPWLPLVALGTNLASGVYEYGRTLYGEAERRVIAKSAQS